MKNKAILFLSSLIIGLSTQIKAQDQREYILNCQFKGLPDKTKVYLTTQEIDTVQKVLSNGDRFIFKGKLDPEGQFLFINFDTLVTKSSSKAIFVANRPIKVNGTIGSRDVEVIGSPEQEHYKLSNDLPNRFGQQMNEFMKLNNIQVQTINDNIKLTEAEKALEIKKIDKELLRASDSIKFEFSTSYKKWLLEHKTSLFAPYAMHSMFGYMQLTHVKEIFNVFSKSVQESYYGKQLKEAIDMAAEPKIIKEGAVFPDLSVYNMEGKTEKLLDVVKKNKLTLIDCWASWCKPCRAEVPELKKMYTKYKDKGFIIIGVSSDKDEVAWKKSVKDDQTTWPHFIEDKTKLISKTFDLKAIPAYILVDSEGELLAFDCGMSSIPNFGGGLRGENLDKKLEELLGK